MSLERSIPMILARGKSLWSSMERRPGPVPKSTIVDPLSIGAIDPTIFLAKGA
jgi:hypothetical protein